MKRTRVTSKRSNYRVSVWCSEVLGTHNHTAMRVGSSTTMSHIQRCDASQSMLTATWLFHYLRREGELYIPFFVCSFVRNRLDTSSGEEIHQHSRYINLVSFESHVWFWSISSLIRDVRRGVNTSLHRIKYQSAAYQTQDNITSSTRIFGVNDRHDIDNLARFPVCDLSNWLNDSTTSR